MTDQNREAADRYSALMEETVGKAVPVTDRFVPTEPGLYWGRSHNKSPWLVITVKRNPGHGGLECYVPRQSWANQIDFFWWLAPVTPPDVVREMREALEWYAEQALNLRSQRHQIDAQFALGEDSGSRARAALAKLGRVGA